MPQAGAGEAALIVEDETGVCAVAAERLRKLDYRVLEAEDGLPAPACCGSPPPKYTS